MLTLHLLFHRKGHRLCTHREHLLDHLVGAVVLQAVQRVSPESDNSHDLRNGKLTTISPIVSPHTIGLRIAIDRSLQRAEDASGHRPETAES